MSRYLVITDMHFGTPESAVNDAQCRGALVSYLVSAGPWDEIVLAGDILDANLSTLSRSIEGYTPRKGDKALPLCGFRQFLAELFAAAEAKGGPAALVKHWVYVPGNHDYKVWDILSSKVAFQDPVAGGDVCGKRVELPLERHAWRNGEAFVSGIWKGAGCDASASVDVEYPDHRIAFGADDLLVTHGHYLDPSQTRFNDLTECLTSGSASDDGKKIVRRIFIETAQYQAVASAMSYRRDTERAVDWVFGPAGCVNKLHRLLSAIGAWLGSLSFSGMGKRAPMSPGMLRNVDAYIKHFPAPSAPARPVKWFVLGHTHVQGAGSTPEKVQVWNAGSCYEDAGKAITFAQIDVEGGSPQVHLKGIAREGTRCVVV